EGPPKVVVVRRIVSEQLRPGDPVLTNRSGQKVMPECGLHLFPGDHHKHPESSTMSCVRLYFVTLTVTRGASGTIPPEPVDSCINPLTLPSGLVVTATGPGRRPGSE